MMAKGGRIEISIGLKHGLAGEIIVHNPSKIGVTFDSHDCSREIAPGIRKLAVFWHHALI